jgi:hypothetical protein
VRTAKFTGDRATGLRVGYGIFVRLLKPGLNASFAVLFLRTQNFPHHGSLEGFVRQVRAMARFLAGPAWCLSSLAHNHILLRPRPWGSTPAKTIVSRDRPRCGVQGKTSLTRLRQALKMPLGSRTAKISPTDSAPRRRATKASACAEAAAGAAHLRGLCIRLAEPDRQPLH